MPKPMRVEIVAEGAPEFRCDPPETVGWATAAPGSLTEAKLRLAEATDVIEALEEGSVSQFNDEFVEAHRVQRLALMTVRNHPDYQAVARG